MNTPTSHPLPPNSSAPLLLRTGWPVSLVLFAVTIHLGLPRPTRLYYAAQIKKGWKGGTKLKFNDLQHKLDVVFVLNEGKDERFVREGDDLKTSVIIGKTKARKGCTVMIDPLNDNELPIMLKLRAGEIARREQVVIVKGRGWPKRSSSSGATRATTSRGRLERGDLLVTVSVVSDAKAERRQRKKRKEKRRKVPSTSRSKRK